MNQEILKKVIIYDPDTGVFFWKKNMNIAGTKCTAGYIQIRYKGKHYMAHRLAFLYMTGLWPTNVVDHIDNVRNNNSWVNLREATISQNIVYGPIFKNNTSGYKGVRKSRAGTWIAYITVKRKQIHLGTFKSPELAHEEYLKAVDKYYGKEFRYINHTACPAIRMFKDT